MLEEEDTPTNHRRRRRRRRRHLIIAGRPVTSHQRFSYYCALFDYQGGGILLTPTIVLTAGHVVDGQIRHPKHDKETNNKALPPVKVGAYQLPEQYQHVQQDDDDTDDDENNNDDDDNDNGDIDNGQRHLKQRFLHDDDDDDDDDDADTWEADIVDIVRHPQFQRLGGDEFRNDVALIRLSSSSSSSKDHTNNHYRSMAFPRLIRPSMFSNNNNYNNVNNNQQTDDISPWPLVTVVGLGTTNVETGDRPTVLQQTTLQVVNHATCQKRFDKADPPRTIDPTHLCTETPHDDTIEEENNDDRIHDACSYDSGGPLLWLRDDDSTTNRKDHHDIMATNSYDVVVGLVSWGIGCADEYFPGVNTNLLPLSSWIDDTVCQWYHQQQELDENKNNPAWDLKLLQELGFPCTKAPSKHDDGRQHHHWYHLPRPFKRTTVVLSSIAILLLYMFLKRRSSRSHHQPLQNVRPSGTGRRTTSYQQSFSSVSTNSYSDDGTSTPDSSSYQATEITNILPARAVPS